VIRCSGVTMTAGGDTTLRRGKGENDASWTNTNLTRPKNKENSYGRFSWYKWTMKIQSNDALIYFLKKHMQVRSSLGHLITYNTIVKMES
jgi:hypothetical protein